MENIEEIDSKTKSVLVLKSFNFRKFLDDEGKDAKKYLKDEVRKEIEDDMIPIYGVFF